MNNLNQIYANLAKVVLISHSNCIVKKNRMKTFIDVVDTLKVNV